MRVPARHFCSLAAEATTLVDAVVVGAGVVGLACARALALAGQEVVVLEQAGAFGTGTSARHSEVIHAGIYYPPGSLKARLCVQGKARLYDFCAARDVPHKRLGKLIVAANDRQLQGLRQLQASGAANGVPDLQLLAAEEARALEPELACAGALLSPSTGILDSHSYMQALLADLEAQGGLLATHTRAVGARPGGNGGGPAAAAGSGARRHIILAEDAGGGGAAALSARLVVNAAGLGAHQVAGALAPLGLPAAALPPRHLARGCYFALSGGRAPFGRLVYPLPEPGGLGVHLTLDLGGQAKFGPDVEWLPDGREDYTVDPGRAERFYPAVRQYWPGLPEGALVPAYAGIRPKISGPGQPPADFLLQGPRDHGVPGLVNLFGIESPGLTSSLAIGERVRGMLLHGAA